MKKILMMCAALFAAVNMNAQSAGEMYVKPMIGGTLSTITKTDADMKFGVVGGAEFGYNLSDNLALTAGALFTMEGAKKDESGIKSTTELSYLNVPLLLNYYVAPGFAVKAGIQPGFFLSQETKIEGGGQEIKVTGSDGLNKFDLSIPVGVSYEFSNFVIDARYNLGLLKIAKDDDHHYETSDGKNSFFMLTIGYKINF